MNGNAEKWVEALRSGEFSQTRGYLRTVNDEGEASHCCLGVACELYAKEHPEAKWDGRFFVAVSGDENDRLLPESVRAWLGLSTTNGAITGRALDGEKALTSANDRGASFVTIADLIESEPEGLFA